jgi:integrase
MSRDPIEKPAPFSIGKIRVRAMRPPTAEQPRRWYWRAMRGRKETIWAGRATRDEAEASVLSIAVRLAGGEDIRRGLDCEAQTVADVLAYYLGDCQERVEAGQLKETTLKGYKSQRARIRLALGPVLVVRLSSREVERWVRGQLSRGAAPLTVRGDIILLRAALKWAASVGLCEPAELAWPRVAADRVREKPTPTREQVFAVWQELASWPDEQDAFLFLASTGARQGELNGLLWKDVDLRGEQVALIGTTGRRLIPVAGDCLAMLRRRRMASLSVGPVFGSRARGITLCQRKLPVACKAAGVPRLTPHALRRFVSSELIEQGTDPRTYEAIMGHTLQVGLRDYAESRAATRRGAVYEAGLGSILDHPTPSCPLLAR